MKTKSGVVSLSPAASLSKIYYSPGGYWKGYSAFSKLADAAGVSENEAKEWLKLQALWQIYLRLLDIFLDLTGLLTTKRNSSGRFAFSPTRYSEKKDI